MANTTFKGPVRSEDGFNAITENSLLVLSQQILLMVVPEW